MPSLSTEESFTVSTPRLLGATCVLLTCLTAFMTYPLVTVLATGLPDVGDPLLNTWALSWIAHQLPIAPARIFDANIFYPERATLAYSETLLAPGIAAAPLAWLGAGPVLVYNLVFLSGTIGSGIGSTLLVRDLTRSSLAGVVAGIGFTFLPFRPDHASHLQMQLTPWIPLTLWALHRVIERGRRWDGAWLGLFAALQLLSCVYFGLFLLPFAGVVALVLGAASFGRRSASAAADGRGRFLRRRALALALAGAVYAAVTAPVGAAYIRASRTVGERNLDEVAVGSARPSHYMGTNARSSVYGRWAERFGEDERRLFPGLVVVVLAALGLCRLESAAQFAYLTALLLAFDMSLGVHGFSYPVLWEHFSPMRALRIPARMGLFVGFALTVLAGYGAARLMPRSMRPVRRIAVAAGLSLVILIESHTAPSALVTLPKRPPPVYTDLLHAVDAAPRTAIVEIPMASHDPTYMYYSTFHWQNLLNGYSGFYSPGYIELLRAMERFPNSEALDALRWRQARYVVIHGELLDEAEYRRLVTTLDANVDFSLVARRPWQGREISLYRLSVPLR